MRRGISELVGAIFAAFVIIALAILLVYVFNMFKETSQKLEAKLRFEQKLIHARVKIVNFTATGSGSVRFIVKLYPALASYVRTVTCTLLVSPDTQLVEKCRYFINDSSTITVNVRYSSPWRKAYMSFAMKTGDVVIVPVYSGPILIWEVPIPGVDYAQYVNGTYRGVLSATTLFQNNSTGWTCIDAILNFTCTARVPGTVCQINGTSYIVIRKVFCVDPLATYVVPAVFSVYCEEAPCNVDVNVTLMMPSGIRYSYVIPVMRIYP